MSCKHLALCKIYLCKIIVSNIFTHHGKIILHNFLKVNIIRFQQNTHQPNQRVIPMKYLDSDDFPKFKRPLVNAINKSGGHFQFSKLLNVSRQTVYAWLYVLEKGVPAERCPEIEAITSGEITRKELRPDIFGECPERPKLTPKEELMITIKKMQKQLKSLGVWVDTWDYSREAQKQRNKPKKGVK